MEPNIDRTMWGVIVLIIAVVVGVLAKDKIYHAVDSIFGKHSEAIQGVDVGKLGTINKANPDEGIDLELFVYSGEAITGFNFDTINAEYGGVAPSEIRIPTKSPDGDTITTIADNAFYEQGITKVTLPNSIKVIGNSAFQLNPLTQINFNNGLEVIGDRAFMNTDLTAISFPSSLTSIGYASFYSSDVNQVNFQEGLVAIGAEAFSYTAITELTLPASLTNLGEKAFMLSQLTKLTFKDGTNNLTVGDSAFEYNALSEITLSDNITSIGANAFANNGAGGIIKATLLSGDSAIDHAPTLRGYTFGWEFIYQAK